MAQIWHCCRCGMASSYSSDLTPSLETSMCHECGPKKKAQWVGSGIVTEVAQVTAVVRV